MKNNYRCYHWVVLIPLLCSFFFLGKMNASPFDYHFIYKPHLSFQQRITGTVSDQQGVPIPGVNVIVQGSSTGTMTNLDGEYTIAASVGDTLLYSYIGFKAFKIEVSDSFSGDITLETSVDALDEVVINAGYYNTTQRERTGNISRVTGEEIEVQPLTGPLQALQGRMAGVEITPGGSHPGMAPRIRIRGTNSLRQEGNYPLYIIDGVPINSIPMQTNSLVSLTDAGVDPLSNLDLNNIESIEILKDADATAIYGSRGANGVVLISTKSGYHKDSGFNISFYSGITKAPQRIDLLNTDEYLQMRRKAFENDGVEPTERNAYDLLLWDQDKYTDWQEFLYGGTSETLNASISYSGGGEHTSFRLGGSYLSQGTIYPGDYNYNKITGNLSLNHRSENEKFNLNLSLNYGADVNNLVGNVAFSNNISVLPPNAPRIFNEDGSLAWEEWGQANLSNPLQGYFNRSKTLTDNLISNLSISYELAQGLELKANLGYNFYDLSELRKQPRSSYNPATTTIHYSYHINNNRRSWIVEPQLLYSTEVGKLEINALLGATFQDNNETLENFHASGYATEALIGNLAAAENIYNANRNETEYKYSAIFSRIGLNWQDKYYLNFTGRRDGSSRFGSGNRFANFGAIGLAWIFSSETFFEDHLKFLSFGKIRGSYGTTGNDQIGDYGYLDAYEPTLGAGGLYPTRLANPDYSWEVNKKFEFGLELGFLKNALSANISYYRNRSSNQLVGYALPAITGFTSVQANLPATVQNSGLELEISSDNLHSDTFKWETSLNFTLPKNKLVSYPNIEQSSYANTYRVGSPLNILLLYEYTGIDPETGFFSFNDVNADGSYDYRDMTVVHDQNRNFYGGLSNTITYKNISLQFLFQYVDHQAGETTFYGGRAYNTRSIVLEALNGPVENVQRISQSSAAARAYNYASISALSFEDASFLRLKTLSLSYALPKKLLDPLSINNVKLYVHGQNLFTMTNYNGMDPELGTMGIGNLRSVTGGAQINF